MVVGEDSLLVREGISTLLAPRDDIEVVELCDDLPRLTEAVERQRPDVVVTDIRMPPTGGDEGIQVTNRLHEESLGTGVVVLSQYAEPGYALDLFRAGSEGRTGIVAIRASRTRPSRAYHHRIVRRDGRRLGAKDFETLDPAIQRPWRARRRDRRRFREASSLRREERVHGR